MADAHQTGSFRIEISEAQRDKAMHHAYKASCEALEQEIVTVRAALRHCGCRDCAEALDASLGRMSE